VVGGGRRRRPLLGVLDADAAPAGATAADAVAAEGARAVAVTGTTARRAPALVRARCAVGARC
jgi:hypothetical protein